MPVMGLTSGKKIKLSERQFGYMMTKREIYIAGGFIDIYDEDKKVVGRVKTDAIEYIAPDDSPMITDKPFNPPKIEVKPEVEKPKATSYQNKNYTKKKI